MMVGNNLYQLILQVMAMFRNERSYKIKWGEKDFNTKRTNTDFYDILDKYYLSF